MERKDAIKILEKEKEGLKKILQMPLDRNPSGTIEALKTDEQYNLLMEKPFDICENWIPCTEQLPKNNTWVLYSDKNGVVSDCHYYNGFNQFEHSNGEHEMTDIIAWMPKPEPYKAESEKGGE